jgi:hypothetical protein
VLAGYAGLSAPALSEALRRLAAAIGDVTRA